MATRKQRLVEQDELTRSRLNRTIPTSTSPMAREVTTSISTPAKSEPDKPRENPPAELVDAYQDQQELAAERAALEPEPLVIPPAETIVDAGQ